jgi:hypothetical protein
MRNQATNETCARTRAREHTHRHAHARARTPMHPPAHACARKHTHKPARACTCVYASRRPLPASRGARRQCTPCRDVAGLPSRVRRAKVLTSGPARPPAVSAARTQAGFEPGCCAPRLPCSRNAPAAGPASHGNCRPSAHVPRCLLQARSMLCSAAAGWRRTRTSYCCFRGAHDGLLLRMRRRGMSELLGACACAAALRRAVVFGNWELPACAALARGPPQTAPRRPHALGPPPRLLASRRRRGPRRRARSPEGSQPWAAALGAPAEDDGRRRWTASICTPRVALCGRACAARACARGARVGAPRPNSTSWMQQQCRGCNSNAVDATGALAELGLAPQPHLRG